MTIRALSAHQLAFPRIVIDKNHTVDSYIQILRYIPQICRFILPIDSVCGKMFTAQHHIGMTIKYIERVAFIIFAVDCQKNSPVVELEQLFLEISIAVAGIVAAEADPFNTVFPHYPTP